MKTVFFIIAGAGRRAGAFLIAAALLCGCTSEGKHLSSDAPAGGIEVAATDTDDHAVTITSSASWMVDTAGVPEWFSVRYHDDNPGLLWAKALGRNESLDSLRATITVISGDGLRLDIPFVQLPMEVAFGVSPRTLEPFGPRESAPRILTVASTLTWEHLTVGTGDWLTITRSTDPDTGAELLTVEAKPTRSPDPRRDTIVVRPVNEAFRVYSDSIAIVQRGIDLVVESEAMNPDDFEIEVAAEGGETTLWVYSRNEWTVAPDAPAERVALDVAGGDADIENGVPVVMTLTPNTSTEEFTFTLTFTAGGETYEYTCRQQGATAPPPQEQEEQEEEGNEGT